MPNGDAEITAEFERDEPLTPPSDPHDVIVSTKIVGGSVTADKDKADTGETVTLTVTPDDGYKIKYVKVNGAAIGKDANGKYCFTMPNGDAEITAEFEPTGENPIDPSKPGPNDDNKSDKADDGLGATAITFIVLGCAAAVAAIAVISAVVIKKRRKGKSEQDK